MKLQNKVFGFFLLLLVLSPLVSAVLSTADSIGAYSTTFIFFLIGAVFLAIGIIMFKSESFWFIGLFFCGLGLILILYDFVLLINLSSQLGVTGLQSSGDELFGKVMIGLKYFVYLLIIGVIIWGINIYNKKRQSLKPSADGWDGNNNK